MTYIPRGPGGDAPGEAPTNGRPLNELLSAWGESEPAALAHALVQFPVVPLGRRWLVHRIAVYSTSTTPSIVAVYDIDDSGGAGGSGARNLLGVSNLGNRDYDDAATPYVIESGKRLYITWNGVSNGSIATARIQYQLVDSDQ